MKAMINIPLDVPNNMRGAYEKNLNELTKGSGRLMIFAGDQKIEHLNDDFYGKGIHLDDSDPDHLFRIASTAKIGGFATQFGLIARYGRDYPKIPYIVKLNSKTNLVKTKQMDPYAGLLAEVSQVAEFRRNTGLKILGVGYTIYLGSEYDPQMLERAAKVVYEAHKNGLVAIMWIYPRGKAVKDETSPHIVAGASGVAACLGADFVKVSYPKQKGKDSREIFREAVKSAGRTGVICAGGPSTNPGEFLERIFDQIHVSGARGNATGRNIHQKGLEEAVRMCNAIYAITVEDKSVREAMEIYKGD